MRKFLSPSIALFILCLFHISALIGIQTDYKHWFLDLTPLNLMLCFGLILAAEPLRRSRPFWIWAVAIIVFGFILEVIGVNTGYPFGTYWYGSPFGWQWMGTPFLIGINWFLMVYGGALITKNLTGNLWLDALCAGVLIVLIDLVLEPVAIYLGFWDWEAATVPLQNYATWGVVVFLFSRWLYSYLPTANNVVARLVIGVQFLFFVGVYLLRG